jgi:hypothetical protein
MKVAFSTKNPREHHDLEVYYNYPTTTTPVNDVLAIVDLVYKHTHSRSSSAVLR